MEKKLLLAKSILQTCFYGIKEQKNWTVLIGIITLLSLFDFLFYKYDYYTFGIGINLFIMTVFSLATVICIYQPAMNNKLFWWASFGVIISSLNCFYHTDVWAFFLFFISYCLVVASLHNKLYNIALAMIQWGILQCSAPIYGLYWLFNTTYWKQESKKPLLKMAKIAVIPILIISVFTGLYGMASQHFFDTLIQPILSMIQFESLHLFRFFFWGVGAVFIIPLLVPVSFKKILLTPLGKKKHINRNRKKINQLFKNLDLSQELKMSVFTMIGLNILVCLFNILDLIYLWFGNQDKSAAELSQYVHDGTNMVILSIGLGVSLIAYFFRRNLNFHPKNQGLKLLSYIWIFQNVFLACSTFTRNFHYVNQYGLTYKRLGVIIFIITVISALIFVYQKIKKQQSMIHLINKQLLAIYIILLSFSLLDHESVIIKHAAYLQKAHVDLPYLTKISSEHDYLLLKYRSKLEEKSGQKLERHESYRGSEAHWKERNWLTSRNNRIMKQDYWSVYQPSPTLPTPTFEEQLKKEIDSANKIQKQIIQAEETELIRIEEEPIPINTPTSN